MMFKLLLLASGLTAAVATNASYTFYPPKATPFLTIDFTVGWPVNVTTPNAVVATVPNAGGKIDGELQGNIIANLSAGFETVLKSTKSEYTNYQNQYVFLDKSGNSFLVKMAGIAQYANADIHGFAHVTIETGVPSLQWLNYAMFVGEWNGAQDSGTGVAKLEIFQITTGGRRDGKCIPAIEPESK